jgi:hypothetical protein
MLKIGQIRAIHERILAGSVSDVTKTPFLDMAI